MDWKLNLTPGFTGGYKQEASPRLMPAVVASSLSRQIVRSQNKIFLWHDGLEIELTPGFTGGYKQEASPRLMPLLRTSIYRKFNRNDEADVTAGQVHLRKN